MNKDKLSWILMIGVLLMIVVPVFGDPPVVFESPISPVETVEATNTVTMVYLPMIARNNNSYTIYLPLVAKEPPCRVGIE